MITILIVFLLAVVADVFCYAATPADFRLQFPWYWRWAPLSGFVLLSMWAWDKVRAQP